MMSYIAYLIMVWMLIGIGYLFHSFIIFEKAVWSPLTIRIIIVISIILALIIRMFCGELSQERGLV